MYIGVTNNLRRRIKEHKAKINNGFSSRYNCTDLIYFEVHTNIAEAILREKRMKRWNRIWKDELIKELNPQLKDLSSDWE